MRYHGYITLLVGPNGLIWLTGSEQKMRTAKIEPMAQKYGAAQPLFQ